MITDEMGERGLHAAEEASDARLPRHSVVRAILEAALGDMVLVPREPTEAMRMVWAKARPNDAVVNDDGSVEAPTVSWWVAQYAAMLGAAP